MCVRRLLYILNCWFIGSCMFSSQPETVTVIIGESAEFGCRCEGSSSIPRWIIQGSVIPAFELSYPYEYIRETFSLFVHEVTLSMNSTTIRCLVNDQPSSEGTLFVKIIEEGT